VNPRWTLIAAAATAAFGIACSPPEPPPAVPPPPVASAPPPVEPTQPPEPPFLYYRMTQAGHVELLVDEVRLDPAASRCFQARRRQIGGLAFEQRKDQVDRTAYAAEVDRVVKVWKEGSKKGAKPTVVLHGHADRDEADSADAARQLSRARAETVRAWLVERGIPENLLRVEAHGWDLSPVPLQPANALPPNRRVEISHDAAPPSEAKVTESGPVDATVLHTLLERARALEGKVSLPADSKLAPRVAISLRDANGTVDVAFDVVSSSPEALALHRYFLAGLSNGCSFGPVP